MYFGGHRSILEGSDGYFGPNQGFRSQAISGLSEAHFGLSWESEAHFGPFQGGLRPISRYFGGSQVHYEGGSWSILDLT